MNTNESTLTPYTAEINGKLSNNASPLTSVKMYAGRQNTNAEFNKYKSLFLNEAILWCLKLSNPVERSSLLLDAVDALGEDGRSVISQAEVNVVYGLPN
jgi:hypothetical protein